MSDTETVTEEQSSPAETALAFVIHANHGHLWSLCDRRWCRYGQVGRGLYLHESAWTRLGQVFGYIEGVASKDHDAGLKLAADFICQLDAMSRYGGWVDADKKPGNYVPQYVTHLYDDGTFNGFSFMRYRAFDWDAYRREKQLTGPQEIAFHCRDHQILVANEFGGHRPLVHEDRDGRHYAYRFDFNGGFLYGGPRGDELLNVQLRSGSNLWACHT
jgi:hypothetical protein